MNQQNYMAGQAPLNYPTWTRLPIYNASPIHGENAAWQFPMGPNSEIYLPDADEDVIWWIRTDNNNCRSVQGFDVTPHKKPEPINAEEILSRLEAVEEWINGKSNKPAPKRSSTTGTATIAE